MTRTRLARLRTVDLLGPLALFASAFLAPAASAQDLSAPSKISGEVQVKIRQIEVLQWIQPLAMNRKQANSLLSALEKAKTRWEGLLKEEDKDIVKLQPKVDEALDQAFKKDAMPPKALRAELEKLNRAMAIRRQLIAEDMVSMVEEAIIASFNEGQRKVMANSVQPLGNEPTEEVAKQKAMLRLYIRTVLFDPSAYPVIRRLAKEAQE